MIYGLLEGFNLSESMVKYSVKLGKIKKVCRCSAKHFWKQMFFQEVYSQPEFLKVPVSWSSDLAKVFRLCAKSWDVHAQSKMFCILTSFTVFSSFFTHNKRFLVKCLHFFLRKISKIKFWLRKRNLLLESMLTASTKFSMILLEPPVRQDDHALGWRGEPAEGEGAGRGRGKPPTPPQPLLLLQWGQPLPL